MTNFVTEARRLGIPAPYGSDFATDGDYLVARPGFYTEGVREDRLCVDGCADCRNFRQAVRDAMTAEATRVVDFEREEAHAVQAALELAEHVDLLPRTRMSELAAESLDAAIGLVHLAFDEARGNGYVLNVGQTSRGQSEDEFAAMLEAMFGGTPFDFDAEFASDI